MRHISHLIAESAAPQGGEILTEPEVAQRLRQQPRTIRSWRKKHGLPHLKLTAKCVRFNWNDVLAWLDRHRTATIA